jgi:Zn-dependent peptidase ImmA (M78 family)/DNA-binding XRE family transcriptional regulator
VGQRTTEEEPGSVNPEMVTLARESRGLTQSAAAKRLGVSQARLSKIEAGLAPVPDELVPLMAHVLGYPRRFFSLKHPILGPGTSEFFHRKRQATPVRTLKQLHAAMNIRMINIARLLTAVEIERDDIPRLDPDEFGTAADIAQAVRAKWNVPPGPVKNVVQMIEDAGGIVVPCDFGTPLIDAVSRYVPGLPRVFFVDANISGDRMRLTLAHELGHVVMHQLPHPDMETHAYQFGAEFLMPGKEIRPQLDHVNIPKLASLKPFWKVSMGALLMRARDVGRVSPRMERYLWSQMSRAGYKAREPAELDIPREEPRLLAEIIQVHREELGYGLRELSDLIGLSEEEAQGVYEIEPSRADVRPRLRVVKLQD